MSLEDDQRRLAVVEARVSGLEARIEGLERIETRLAVVETRLAALPRIEEKLERIETVLSEVRGGKKVLWTMASAMALIFGWFVHDIVRALMGGGQ